MHLCRSSSNVPRLPSFLEMLQKPSRLAHIWQGAQSLAPATRNEIWTSKSGPYMVCFEHFDFEMCFAPQWRALFRHRNFQKCSERGVLFAFSLANVLRATTACTFSSLIWPDGSAPAALASLLFDPQESQIIGNKTQCFATFLPFRAPASFFFWLFLFSDLPSPALLSSTLLLFSLTLSISAFHLSILSEVWLLNFLRQIDYFKSLFPQGLYFWPNKNHPEVHHFVRLQDLLQICCDEGWAGLRHWNYGLDTGVTMKIHGIETWKHGKWSWI